MTSPCGRAAERAPEVVGAALRVLEVEPGRDLAVEDPASLAQLARPRPRHRACGRREPALQPSLQHAVPRVADGEDDDERALRPLAEVLGEQLRGPVGLGAGHGERRDEDRGQLRRGERARDRDGRPAGEDEGPAAEHGTGPALGHPAQRTPEPPELQPERLREQEDVQRDDHGRDDARGRRS